MECLAPGPKFSQSGHRDIWGIISTETTTPKYGIEGVRKYNLNLCYPAVVRMYIVERQFYET